MHNTTYFRVFSAKSQLYPFAIKTSLNNNSNDVDVGIFYFTGNTNNASCKSISVSTTTPKTGSTFTANIQFTNTGNTTWTNSNNYHLGDPNAYYPQDSLWGGFNRVNLSFDPIPPSQTGTFTFTATAPNTPGNYTFNWKMIQDGVEWFEGNWKEITTNISPNSFLRDSSGQLLLTIIKPERDAYNPQNNTVSWQVYFEDRLGSKSMFTGAWVEDSNKKFDLKADINPSP